MKRTTLLSVLQKVLVAMLSLILVINLYLLVMQLAFKVELPKVFGFGQVIVISGSMEPAISAGDLLIIRQQSEYKVDDVITYQWGNSLCTHRIVAMEGNTIVTQGDANNAVDEPIDASLVEGKVVFRIPGFGNFILFLKTPIGLLVIAVLAIVLVEAPNFMKKVS